MADRINFEHPINDSAQVGDILYHTPLDQNGIAISAPILIGPITQVGENSVVVDGSAPSTSSGETSFYMFRKNAEANVSTLLGYFANISINSSSTGAAELYSVGSEIFLSSK